MASRFGRKKRKAALERIACLERDNTILTAREQRQGNSIRQLQQQIREGEYPLQQIFLAAKAQVVSRTADAILHAETEFMRECLSEMRRAGFERMELSARSAGGPVGWGADQRSAQAQVVTIYIRAPVQRSFVVDLPLSGRRRA